ncbi:hypothetical protein [Sulfurimonas sp.]|uniref:hypothetical protein n=1 Tax=Sulfurimonas sp. TaxID=2022749 RepID=UPI0025D80C40|nr:hypothetical protein [Sulfurimonas sp.]MDD5156995.1 hypothetical protein [Sulfurimonas sp.]
MTFEQQWIENDYNPFVIFDKNAKVLSLNSEAQFLLGVATTDELFSIATTYANVSFGFKTTFIELEFGRYSFFAITIGYENENEIGIKLYRTPSFKINKPKPSGELINIYALVDLCISSKSINSKIEFTKDFDPTIPEITIDSNSFIKVLSKAYECFEQNSKINTKIFYRVGEHIKYEDKKYSIFSIEISAEIIDKQKINTLEALTATASFYIEIKKSILINIPMITA